jgi:hypothetical protein
MRKSFKFVDEDWDIKPATRRCEKPGCMDAGEFRAPKNRDRLDEYYWFCVSHVREYNEHWNFYAGMNDREVEAHHRSDSTWQRPTWPMGQNKFTKVVENSLNYHPLTGCFPGENLHAQVNDPNAKWFAHHTDECKALVLLELDQPVTFQVLREAYKCKVKQYHPDANKGCKYSEERLKSINVAYGLLKKSFLS